MTTHSTGGVTETTFATTVDGRLIPGVVWTPEGANGPRPLVLIGHGATHHKRVGYAAALAHGLVRDHGLAAAAIDGPGHGERRDNPADAVTIFGEFMTEWYRPTTVDEMVADWKAALELIWSLPAVGRGPVGYWGLSMGTIYGLPLAVLEPAVKVAVFGLMGLLGPTKDRLAADAASVRCPVLFIQQWDDALVPRQDSLD
ncbi:MAG: dienelactone hydrolase family protein, partial [Pseudonocardiaceae bacterium]